MSSRGDRTTRCVHGALMSMLNDHGPITRENMHSAVKRIVAQIRAEGNRILQVEGAGVTETTEHLYKQLQKLRHGHEIAVSQYERCRAERDELRGQVEHLKLLLVRDGITMTPEQLRRRARV